MRCALRACARSGFPRSLSHSLGLTLRLAHRSLTRSFPPTLAHWFPYKGSAGAAAGGAGCDGGGGVGLGGWSSLSRVGSGDGVSCGGRGRGDSRWRVSAGASTSIGWCWLPRVASVAWSRGGRGGGGAVWGWRCWWWGGRGWVLCWLGVWASLWVVWVLRVCAVRSLRFLTGCGAGVWVGGGRMGVQVGLWSVSNGWLLVDGARWYGVWVGGLLVVVGRSY